MKSLSNSNAKCYQDQFLTIPARWGAAHGSQRVMAGMGVILMIGSLCLGAPPVGYYNSADTSSPQALKASLHSIIKTGHVAVGYTPGVWDSLQITDEDLSDPTKVRLIYTGQLRLKSDGCSTNVDPTPPPCNDMNASTGGWNREHAFPQSTFNSDEPMESDLHHVFPIDGDVNSQRSDNPFGMVETPTYTAFGSECDNQRWEARPDQRGDIARALFYMDVRYDGTGGELDLSLVDTVPAGRGSGEMGYLTVLLDWHSQDPVDAFEQTRNDRVYDQQGNRNPFIDHPEWVAIVYNLTATSDGDSVSASMIDHASANHRAGETFPMLSLLLTANSHEWDLGQISLQNLGSISNSNLTVKAYKDSNQNGAVDSGEMLLGSCLFSTTSTLTLIPSARATTDTTAQILLVAQTSVNALPGDTVQLRVEANGLRHSVSGGADVDPSNAALDSGTTMLIAPTGIFISEYVEGSSNNKALEIYNDSSTTVNFSAGGSWKVQMAFNGNPPTITIPLIGTLAPGNTFVLVNSAASTPTLALANQTSGNLSFNGNDAILLQDNTGALVDSFGQVGNNPGSAGWGSGMTATTDHTLRRKPRITVGDTISTDTFNPSLEWDGYAIDTINGLGTHGVDHAPVVGAVGAAILEDQPGPVTVFFEDRDNSTTPTFTAATANVNPGTFGSPQIIKTGTGTYEAQLPYTPPENVFGSVTFDLTISDATGPVSATGLTFTIGSVNDLPTISTDPIITSLLIPKNGNSGAILFTVGDVETPLGDLIVSGQSENETLLPLSGFAFSGSGPNRQVILTPTTGLTGGPFLVTLRVEDEELDSAEITFQVTVSQAAGFNWITY